MLTTPLSLRSIDSSCHPVIATASYTIATSIKSTSKAGFIPVNIASLREEFELAHKLQASPHVVTATPSVSDQDVITIVNEEAKVKLGMAGGHAGCSASDKGGRGTRTRRIASVKSRLLSLRVSALRRDLQFSNLLSLPLALKPGFRHSLIRKTLPLLRTRTRRPPTLRPISSPIAPTTTAPPP